MKAALATIALVLTVAAFADKPVPASYLDCSGRDDVLTGGVRMIPIKTPKGTFRVWTKRVGNNPTHQGAAAARRPGRDARVLRGVRQLLAGRGHRVLLLRPARLVLQRPAGRRRSCGSCRASSTRSSRCARRSASTRTTSSCSATPGAASSRSSTRSQYQQHLKGLIISNMMASIPAYNEYAHDVLMPAMDQTVLAEIKRVRGAPATTRIRATWSC